MRFRKLKKFIKKLYSKEIAIHLTTDWESNILAFGKLKANKIEILLNANYIKTEEQLLVAVAHEVVELFMVVNGQKPHTPVFEKKVKALLKKMSKEFQIDYNNLLNTKVMLDKIAGKDMPKNNKRNV